MLPTGNAEAVAWIVPRQIFVSSAGRATLAPKVSSPHASGSRQFVVAPIANDDWMPAAGTNESNVRLPVSWSVEHCDSRHMRNTSTDDVA